MASLRGWIGWFSDKWKLLVSNEKKWWLWPCAFYWSSYWGCVENLRREQRSSERKGQRKEHKQSRVVGREHPQGRRRGACRLQHTHMPKYWTRHLGVWGEYRVIRTSRQTRGTYLRLLHLVLGIHLCDDLVHVGFQDHPSHHHLCQDVVHLRKTKSFQLREPIKFKQS